MNATDLKIGEYEQKLHRIIDTIKNRFETNTKSISDNVKSFRTRIDALEENEKRAIEEIEKLKRSIKEYEKKLLETRDLSILEREKELRRELDDRRSQVDKEVEEIGQLKDLIQKMQAEEKSIEIERKSTQAMVQVRGCITHTGLSIEPISEDEEYDRIRFTYRRLNPARPKITYSFILNIAESSIYSGIREKKNNE
ncbi:hypothetical protein BCV72DRAFT_216878 [Rhizopus microsporus var. microsporus]|uniref:Kinetochore protein SPC25 n=2 Tax=Rhizopus microsporus TaxID=58291 RepID=A0A2G4SSP0_RHIZD|nr:uncharacterized protein RHIMIDRAFT_18724 [Rhizopus microsporus ATCC 52813]ORE01647.1 hypothetical protein BCV72DRAFT_216878 [Rhizopus microsporus var. microsporus]PHZ11783.1 hypothetical protein RHIMIDRAFT_18724 [Rhizopus microsporus ATCC 52813]